MLVKKSPKPLRHIISSRDFTRPFIEKLFKVADGESIAQRPLSGRVLASLFYESSTRTRFSFEAAMLRLGGNCISTENASEFSSAAKGETIEDTVRVVGAYADVIVLRHPEQGSAQRAAAVSPVPIINAGDGDGEHPTQALLDAYAIQRERGAIDGAVVACCGDLRYGRTVHSLVYLLSLFDDVSFLFVSPNELRLPDTVLAYLKALRVPYTELSSIATAVCGADVLYQTRVQKERISNPRLYKRVKQETTLTLAMLQQRSGRLPTVLHPMPRTYEIPVEVDADPRAAYFRQVADGLVIRAALLRHVLA